METKCVGLNCSFRIKDQKRSELKYVRNISPSKNSWLVPLLQGDGVDTSGFSDVEGNICFKCYRKYERRRSDTCRRVLQPVNAASTGVDAVEGRTLSSTETGSSRFNDDITRKETFTNENDASHVGDDVNDDDDDDDGFADSDSNDHDDGAVGSSRKSDDIGSNRLPLVTIDDLLYGAASHRRCTICMHYSDTGLSLLPNLAKRQLIFHHKIWCPDNARVCPDHLIGESLHPDVILITETRSPLKEHLSDRADQIINDLLYISHSMSIYDNLPRLELTRLSDSDCKAWTGWTLTELKTIHDACEEYLPDTTNSSENALLLFWAKLKTNISWPQLSIFCGMPKTTVRRTFYAVLSALSKTMSPKFLGTKHMTRTEALTHNTEFTKTFYGDKVTLILDGTYIYIQKSSDHKLQRCSYSGQKKRNLIKFMSVVFPDGYVLDTIGPFFGNENDAKITEAILLKIGDLKTWLQETDNLIVDRGFRDVLDLLRSSGYEPHMPSYMKPGQSQHDTATANKDRRCTKTRWVVESYHGRLKQWCMFKNQLISNYFIPSIGDLVQVVTACLNGIRGPIYEQNPGRTARDVQLAKRMQIQVDRKNSLASRVESDPNLSKRCKAQWEKIEACNIPFPKLDLEYLETVTCGTYQLKQASGYIEEHTTDDGDYELWVYQHAEGLIRGKIQSRHKSQTKYNVWILYELSDDSNPVQDYYCTCPAGKRTIGMCAHTASILFFLGHMAHQQVINPLPQAKRFKHSMVS